MSETTWTQDAGMSSPTEADNVENYTEQAEASKDAAAASATAAASSATSASGSASTATTKASEGAASAAAGSTSAAASQASRVASEAAKAAAETAKTAAETARDAASASEVASGAAEVAASTSETNAAASAAAALSSQNAAATSAATASTKATESATSAAASEASNVASGVAKVAAETAEANAEAAQTASETAKTASEAAKVAAETAETNASTSAATATTQAGIATTKAGEASTSATSAEASKVAAAASQVAASNSQIAAASSASSAAAIFDQFDDTYLGSKSAEPTVDNDGNALVTGALFYNSATGGMFIWDGAEWIAASAAGGVSLNNFAFTASAGQTSFSGTDDNSNTLVYTQDNLILILNGVILEAGTDYTATDGTTIVLTDATVVNDELNVVAFKTFTTADMVSSSNGGTFYSNVNFNAGIDVTGNITVTGTVDGRDVAADGAIIDSLGTAATTASTDYATAAQGALAASATQPGDLATVATSGAYSDLSGTPSPFDPNTLATVATSGAYSDLSGTPTLGTAATTASTDYATAAQGALADSALQSIPDNYVLNTGDTMTGNLDVGGTVTADGLTVDTNTLHVDSTNNNVGIGTSSVDSNAKLAVSNNGAEGLEIRANSTNIELLAYNRSASTYEPIVYNGLSHEWRNLNGNVAAIESSGSLLVGKTSTGYNSGTEISYEDFIRVNRTNGSALYVGRNSSDGELVSFRKDGSSVGSIGVKGGDLGIGLGTAGLRFFDQEDAILPYNSTTQASDDNVVILGRPTNRFKDLYLSGTANAANFNTTSDATLKTNVETLTGSLDAVKSLRGVSFDWLENGNSEVGVIAQEVEAVLPDVVSTNDQGIKSVKYSNMVAVLIEAMKEQQAQIDDLKAQLNS